MTTPDSRVFVLYGDMPCLVYGAECVDAHGFDERVRISSIREATNTGQTSPIDDPAIKPRLKEELFRLMRANDATPEAIARMEESLGPAR